MTERLPIRALWANYLAAVDALQERAGLRGANQPVADYAERLVCKALGLEQQTQSTHGFDAVDAAGKRYEIKGRRVTKKNGSRQLSALRRLDDVRFDYLVGVLFNEDFSVRMALKIPHAVVKERVGTSRHTNSSVFHLRDDLPDVVGVEDITACLKAVEREL